MPREQKKYLSKASYRIDTVSGRYLGFVFYNREQKKNVRVGARDGWPDNVFDENDAKNARAKIMGKLDRSAAISKSRLEWIEKYKRFDKLVDQYESWSKRKAPNSWQSNLANLKNHVLPWFLGEKALTDPKDWAEYYDDFVVRLGGQAPLKLNGKVFSKNTINNIINAANAFLTFLEKKQRLDRFHRIEKVQVGKEEYRGLEAIYSVKEQEDVERLLREHDPKFGTLFRLLCKSGMRVNEALGLHVGSVVFGSFPKQKEALFKKIQSSDLQVFGFILLKDQPALRKIFDPHGNVPRKPLKGRKEISPSNNRFIPIIDHQVAKELQSLRRNAKANPKGKVEDKLLFGFVHQQFYNAFCQVRDQLGLKDKDIHSTRHTFTTFIAGVTGGDRAVGEEIVGHQSKEVHERYLHLSEELEIQVGESQGEDEIEIRPLAR